MIRVCFTLDDGLKSQINFWNKTHVPATYFILPDATETVTNYGHKDLNILRWGYVRLLAKHNEIGFHGYSTKYEGWGTDKVIRIIKNQIELFEHEVGYKPVSFAYTDMKSTCLPLIDPQFPYIRDYFWRDKDKDGNYNLRIPETPIRFKSYIPKIWCCHPVSDVVVLLKYIKKLKHKGYEYVVIILHEVTDEIIQLGKIIGNAYDTVTFRQIFEGQSSDTGGNPQPATVNKTAAEAGSTPAASPNESEGKC